MKKTVIFICVLAIIISGSSISFAKSNNDANDKNEVNYDQVEVSTSGKIETSIDDSNKSSTVTPSGVSGACTLTLIAIGSGLLDCDWSIFMSTHLISNISGLIELDYGLFDLGKYYLDVERDVPVWNHLQVGTEQTSFFTPGTAVDGEFYGTVTLNGVLDYPFATPETANVTVQ